MVPFLFLAMAFLVFPNVLGIFDSSMRLVDVKNQNVDDDRHRKARFLVQREM